jgi:hypothetical protein
MVKIVQAYLTAEDRKQTAWLLASKRNIPTQQPPRVREDSVHFCGYRSVAWLVHRVPATVDIGSLDRRRYFSFMKSLNYAQEAEWIPLQTHYFSENVVALDPNLGSPQ